MGKGSKPQLEIKTKVSKEAVNWSFNSTGSFEKSSLHLQTI